MSKVKTQCGSCLIDVVVDTEALTVTAKIPPNGKRGSLYVAPHSKTTEGVDDGSGLMLWECPACEYADSTYLDAETRRTLS